jgi:hypothetical protein
MVTQTGATIRDAAIGELDVELAKRRGDVDDEKAMKETYRCISALISMASVVVLVRHTEKRAGVRRKLRTSIATLSL